MISAESAPAGPVSTIAAMLHVSRATVYRVPAENADQRFAHARRPYKNQAKRQECHANTRNRTASAVGASLASIRIPLCHKRTPGQSGRTSERRTSKSLHFGSWPSIVGRSAFRVSVLLIHARAGWL